MADASQTRRTEGACRRVTEATVFRAPPTTRGRAKALRKALTPPELRLWLRLKARQPGRPVVRNQHPFGPYVLDFFCAEARLAVEVDGAAHESPDRIAADLRRDAYLRERGIETLRIPASDVLSNADNAADTVWHVIAARVGRVWW